MQEQREKSHWHQHVDLLGCPRGTAKEPEIHGSSVLPKLPEPQLVLFCTRATLQGTQSSWGSTVTSGRELYFTRKSYSSHWPKQHSSASRRGGALKCSFTSSDFLCGPVAQIFRQDFAHIAVLWKELNHLQASGSCWKESKEQASYNQG